MTCACTYQYRTECRMYEEKGLHIVYVATCIYLLVFNSRQGLAKCTDMIVIRLKFVHTNTSLYSR